MGDGAITAGRFHSLEGLRGLAAIAVALTHLGLFWRHIVCHGYLAVDLFFLISVSRPGHADEARRLVAGWRPTQFRAARVQRLAPLYLLGALWGGACAFVLARYGVGQSHVGLKLLLALSFAPLLFGAGPIYPLNAPSWSLFDEFVVNLIFGFAAPALTERRLNIALAVAFCALRRDIRCRKLPRDRRRRRFGLAGRHPPRGLQLPLGTVAASLACRGPSAETAVFRLAGFGARFGAFVPVETPLYDLALVGLLFPGLIVVALANEPRGKMPIRLFDLAGLISYPLYVLHWPLAQLLRAGTANFVGLGAGLGFLAAGLPLAYLAARFFDTPVRAWPRRRQAARPPKCGEAALGQ